LFFCCFLGEAGGITQQIGATFFPIDMIKERTAALQKKEIIQKLFRNVEVTLKIPGLLILDTPGFLFVHLFITSHHITSHHAYSFISFVLLKAVGFDVKVMLLFQTYAFVALLFVTLPFLWSTSWKDSNPKPLNQLIFYEAKKFLSLWHLIRSQKQTTNERNNMNNVLLTDK
jgi:hypothetical protein